MKKELEEGAGVEEGSSDEVVVEGGDWAGEEKWELPKKEVVGGGTSVLEGVGVGVGEEEEEEEEEVEGCVVEGADEEEEKNEVDGTEGA